MISKLSPFLDAKIYKDPRLKPALQQLRDWMGPQRYERPEGYLNIDKYFYAYVAYYLPLHFPELYWILEEVKKIESGQDKLNVALVGLQKLFEIAKAEPINIRNRILSLEERIAVLGDLEAFLNDKQSIYRGKLDAILRVAAEESPSRPEKLSVVREAKKIKKNK